MHKNAPDRYPMNKPIASLAIAASIALAGCGGSYTVNRMNGSTPAAIKTAAIAPSDGNSAEVTANVAQAISAKGVAIMPALPANTIKSEKVDMVVSYIDVWRWDLATYMQSISINFYNAQTGELMVTGRWRDSFFHAWHRGESVAAQLTDEMFKKLKE
jgi:hypothetical protein